MAAMTVSRWPPFFTIFTVIYFYLKSLYEKFIEKQQIEFKQAVQTVNNTKQLIKHSEYEYSGRHDRFQNGRHLSQFS